VALTRWRHLLCQDVSLGTVLVAFLPVAAWVAFATLFVAAYRAMVHVSGPAAVVLSALRTLVELGTVVVAMKYFFAILRRGAARELSLPPQERS
jgi:hypothetical protein